LRGCHILQAFKHGKVHSDGIGLSPCAHDSQDWRQYSVNRYLFIVSNCVHLQDSIWLLGLLTAILSCVSIGALRLVTCTARCKCRSWSLLRVYKQPLHLIQQLMMA
jgi:hypothetical protein